MYRVICEYAPSAWASYIINGDRTGIEAADIVGADEFVSYMGGNVVDCGEETHIMRYQGTLCECVRYGALVDDKYGIDVDAHLGALDALDADRLLHPEYYDDM